MLFNSYQFAIFFLAVFALSRVLPAKRRISLLLGASLLFYFVWIPKYLILLLLDVLINYALLRLMTRSTRPGVYLAACVSVSLGLLASFKYAAFLFESFLDLTGSRGEFGSALPDVLLPLGISFYTFQIIALTVDVYRGRIESVRSLREYMLFVCFFPQLIAGPILRGAELLPQLRAGGDPTATRTRRGLWLIGAGLFKKVLLADVLLAPFADAVFGVPGFASAPEQLLAVYSFSFQIYFDFSGYTDIARGCALLLGFELPLNFREPYLSRNPAEFWRRWHITLSKWLRDYLYISLGGNRRGNARTSLNLLITMLLGGLWHGAGWNFVVWGGMHGLLLLLHRQFRNPTPDNAALGRRDWAKIFLMFNAASLLWVFFRVPTFGDAMLVFQRLVTGSYVETWPVMQVWVVSLCVILQVVERVARERLQSLRDALGPVWGGALEGAALGVVASLLIYFGGSGGEFIYFQF